MIHRRLYEGCLESRDCYWRMTNMARISLRVQYTKTTLSFERVRSANIVKYATCVFIYE